MTCPCAVAKATFFDGLSTGPIRGQIYFIQDKYGYTIVSGLLSGFEPITIQRGFKVVDHCGRLIRDLTPELNVQFIDNNTRTKPFSYKFDFNLNCDPEGILLPPTKPCYKRKRSDDGGPVFQVTSNGDAGFADIEE